MANAYFANASPTKLKITLNGGDQRTLDPMSVNSSQNAVTSPAWPGPIKAFKGPDVFGGDQNDKVTNEFLVRSEQSGKTRAYTIVSQFSPTLDLYFFIFEDTIIGEDQTGASHRIEITQLNTETILSLAAALEKNA